MPRRCSPFFYVTFAASYAVGRHDVHPLWAGKPPRPTLNALHVSTWQSRVACAARIVGRSSRECVLRVLEGVVQSLVRARARCTRDDRRGGGEGGRASGWVSRVHSREPDNFPPYLSLGDCARVRSGFDSSARASVGGAAEVREVLFLLFLFLFADA